MFLFNFPTPHLQGLDKIHEIIRNVNMRTPTMYVFMNLRMYDVYAMKKCQNKDKGISN